MVAAECGTQKMAEELINRGANVNYQDSVRGALIVIGFDSI